MDFDQLKTRILTLPGATPEWLAYTVSYPLGRRTRAGELMSPPPHPDRFAVYQGDGRGGTFPALDEHGSPITFASEAAACEWIWAEITWCLDVEAARARPG